ncbi:MAG: pilus assembly protein PilM [Neisseriaceae bacterium]|nr:pilus assembly protein PilM [Neisseriaceae bacterium]
MFAQFKNRLHTQWRAWSAAAQAKPTTMGLGISHEATQIHALQLRQGPQGALTVQHHAHVAHLSLTTTLWGLTEASLAAIVPLLPTPPPPLMMALPNALVQHQYRRLDQSNLTLAEQVDSALRQEVAPDTVAIDYVCLDENPPDSSPLYLLCYTHHDAVNHYQHVAEAQGLRLVCLDVEAFAALNAWYFWLQQQAPEHQHLVLALIHARPTELSVYFCHQQRLLHQVHTPLNPMFDADAETQALSFMQHCWQNFHATHSTPVTQAYITGRHSLAPNLLAGIRQQLNVPLTLAHPVLALATTPPLHPDTLTQHAPDLLIAFGLALRALDGQPS